jgi:hypothetical protein
MVLAACAMLAACAALPIAAHGVEAPTGTGPRAEVVAQSGVAIITPDCGLDGSIDPADPQEVAIGEDATFTMTPAPGYHVQEVLIDGVSVGAPRVYVFEDVAVDHTIAATFEQNPAVVTKTTIKAGSTSLRRGRTLALSGKVTPAGTAGQKVRVYVKKPNKLTWSLLSTRKLTPAAAWKYSYVTKWTFALGTYSFKAVYRATPGFAASTSPTIKVKLKR